MILAVVRGNHRVRDLRERAWEEFGWSGWWERGGCPGMGGGGPSIRAEGFEADSAREWGK